MFEDSSGKQGAQRDENTGIQASDRPYYCMVTDCENPEVMGQAEMTNGMWCAQRDASSGLAVGSLTFTDKSVATGEPAINPSTLLGSNGFLPNAGLEQGYLNGDYSKLIGPLQEHVPDLSLPDFTGSYYDYFPVGLAAADFGSDSTGDMQFAHPAAHSQLPGGARASENELLISLRRAGWGYKEIAAEMHKHFGGVYTPNALIKRFHKIQTEDLKVLSTAVKNVMPSIMQCIETELAGMDLSGLPEVDKQALKGVIEEMADSIPKWVQSRFIKRCKATIPPSPNSIQD
ncbi:hypothetical protein MMYC01_200490 [Madurella mycetomatis]|uniref:Uncharacterized protein n=1 Tax=Madurella mycetomatis TaxID=100816 RepID=A0A175WJL1_9PEZI|nr:hypothetical protein MMYC01_200490 [Madurella mycetomatis]